MSIEPNADTPVDIRGYITDPKMVGYQVLTNYESGYWRALVGNDAWGLYEVLRSFCHNNNRTCHPSIRLLVTTLGLKEKRVLTGWTKTLKGKVYHYPGLIEILQQAGLVIAEVQGKPPKTSYLFHVNLTPGLLTEAQIQQLPAILQKKHAELLARCQREQAELAAKRRPPKPIGGGGKLPPGVVNYHPPGGNLPPEQYPINNTQLTPPRARKGNNNNSDGKDAQTAVVVALTQQGISEKIARNLVERYSQKRIAEKLDYLAFLQQERPATVANPRGWLRKAIEEDYGPPDGYLTAAERARQADATAEQHERQQRAAQQQEELATQRAVAKAAFRRRLQEKYGTSEEDERFWQEVCQECRHSNSHLYELLTHAHILCCRADVVQVGFTVETWLHQLDHPGTRAALTRTLRLIAGRPLTVETVLLAVQEGEG